MHCCTECFSVQEIKYFIINYDEKGECDYCESKNVCIAAVDEVGSFIMEGVGRAYENPANQVGYDSKEGGYLLPTTNIYDLLIHGESIFSDHIDEPYGFINALIPDSLTEYVQKDPYGPPRGDSDERYYWENFCKLVKTQHRYTAFMPEKGNNFPATPHPIDLMELIVTVLSYEHFSIIKKGDKILRARLEKKGHKFSHEELTSPPSRNARNNRMSPAGISLFYGSLDPKTCISELRPSVGERVVVAEFTATKDLTVIDLSRTAAKGPSIFNKQYSHHLESWVSFIRHFSDDISRPIRPMDQEIDYIPTQVFTEFLKRYSLKETFYSGEPGEKKLTFIDGLQFNSSLHEGGKNVVLFRGPEISINNNREKGALLSFEDFTIYEINKVIVEADVTLDD